MPDFFAQPNAYDGQENQWISISDLMSGMMLVFMALAILFMIQLEERNREREKAAQQIDTLVTDQHNIQQELYLKLSKKLEHDLKRWNAELDPDLTIVFTKPEILFDSGSSALKPDFKNTLDEFIPKYVAVLLNYMHYIEEIRIEGHTSPGWRDMSPEDAYQKNMELSQDRTRAVLIYIMKLPAVKRHWATSLEKRITANGLSSSIPPVRHTLEGRELTPKEVRRKSKRVEFRLRTNAQKQLDQINKLVKAGGSSLSRK